MQNGLKWSREKNPRIYGHASTISMGVKLNREIKMIEAGEEMLAGIDTFLLWDKLSKVENFFPGKFIERGVGCLCALSLWQVSPFWSTHFQF